MVVAVRFVQGAVRRFGRGGGRGFRSGIVRRFRRGRFFLEHRGAADRSDRRGRNRLGLAVPVGVGGGEDRRGGRVGGGVDDPRRRGGRRLEGFLRDNVNRLAERGDRIVGSHFRLGRRGRGGRQV